MVALPLARCFGQSASQPPVRPFLPAPERDDLILLSGGPAAPVSLYTALSPLGRRQLPIASGPHPVALLPAGGRKLFLCFAPNSPAETGQPQLAVVDFDNNWAVTTYAYPGPIGSLGVSLGLSDDGRWLYTLTGRVAANDRYSRPEQGGTPSEQAVFYTFDTVSAEFLPQAAETGQEYFDGMVIGPMSNGRVVSLGPISADASSFHSVAIGDDGRAISPPPRPTTQDVHQARKKGTFQCVRSPDGADIYYFQSDGALFRLGAGPARGSYNGIDPIAPERLFGEATVSGDGRLLFVPSGPAKPPGQYGSQPYDWLYVDRISTYRMPDLRKLREQSLQAPLRKIWPSFDGSTLFATEMPRNSLVLLDADTLWRRRVVQVSPGDIESIVVVT
jgi:hypothetical protein